MENCKAQVVNPSSRFRKLASQVACWVGTQWAFMTAIVFILGWFLAGPFFNYSNTWQLVINTATTIITFLMVFLIQSTQNRDAKAIHLKLDELIRVQKDARNKLINLEDASDEELEVLQKNFVKVKESEDGSTVSGVMS